jgi:hypothetical protein
MKNIQPQLKVIISKILPEKDPNWKVNPLSEKAIKALDKLREEYSDKKK